MLDKETKRIIDNARDILVGKVPNPLSQVDLITIAMIYKFMDDMDLDNISLGGKRLFFTGEYEKYAWSNLLSSTVGNNERLNTYAEALDKLPYAKNIPQLFRTIFKDAFLPFRDGATLTMFLKEINNLSYENSENLGDAFEYLLSIMSSQGDAGQFRTPRHIIDFIVEVVNPTKTDSILDPACGTAGFLISAYKHILQQAKNNIIPLSVDEIKNITQNIEGYDIDPTMVKLSLVNLYLHRFSTPRIYEYDTLSSDDRWGDKFDVILANPPFMTPKGGIRPHNKFGIKANRAEVLFVDYFMEHLTLKGKAGFVVPEGIIFQSATAYKSLRKMMIEDNYLYAVVSLPAGIFNPYSGVKTSILFFDRELAKKTDKILFVDIKNDGYDLGAQRRPIKENDLPSALDAIKKYQTSYNSPDLELPSNCLLVEKSKIAENGEYNLTASRYKQTQDLTNSKWEMVKLGDVCELYQPKTITQNDLIENGEYDVYGANGIIGKYDKYNHPNPEVVITCRGATCGTVNMTKEKCWITGNAMVASPKIETLSKTYLYYVLKHTNMESVISGAAQPQITRQSLKELQIPLPPLEVQEEIVKELDGYQAIIDGAQKVVDNWKPTFTINPNWEKVDFMEQLETVKYTTKIQRNAYLTEGQYPIIDQSEEFISGYWNKSEDVFNASTPVVLFGDHTRNIKYVDFDFVLGADGIKILKPNTSWIPKFFFYTVKSVKIKNLGYSRHFKEFSDKKVYRPSLEEQKSIIAKIEQEEQYVDACKKLIELNKQKISDKIKSIWNSDE